MFAFSMNRVKTVVRLRTLCLLEKHSPLRYLNTKAVEYQTNSPQTIAQCLKQYQQWFPQDKAASALIQSYERLQVYPQETITVGIVYHDDAIKQQSRIIETMLSDPLASGNKQWFNEIVNRSKQDNNKFQYNLEPDIINHNYRLPIPVLKASTRPSYMNQNSAITQSDIEIYEINNIETFDNFNTCHFFVYISEELTSPRRLPELVADRILMTIIDNSDFTPSSSESTPIILKRDGSSHIIKINSDTSFRGIMDFLDNDIEALSNYLKSLVESNMFQVLKVLGYNLRVENLITWNLTKIITIIKQDEIRLNELEDSYQDLKDRQITEFSSLMHQELQQRFIPSITQFFNKQLRWWKLYLRNDNVEYDLKDFLSVNFMPQSIESYNVMRGKIINHLQNHQYVNYSKLEPQQVSNPLLVLKNDLINFRIRNEIQPVVSSALFHGLIYYQLPVTLISVAGYQLFDISLNGTLAIFGLGIVMGLNNVAKSWESFVKSWLKTLNEEIRICLDRDCMENGIFKELSHRYTLEKNIIQVKAKIIDGITSNLKKSL